jgi:uncharacterized integral membrane protein (TIGR00698 family)
MTKLTSAHSDLAKKTIFLLLAAATLLPFVSGPMALAAGIAFALLFGNPFPSETKKLTPLLLQLSIIGLGAGMNLAVVGRVGAEGFVYTAVGITLTLLIGWALGRAMKIDPETSLLVAVGTAICGGSAIAAVAPAIRAKNQSVSVALAIVFILNASALVLFPWMGHQLGLTQKQFGLLAALAVHDTSSVVGTALQYGKEALDIATTVKLARALWIVPVTLLFGFLWRDKSGEKSAQKAKRPWFILGFLIAAAIVTWVPALKEPGELLASLARRSLILTLFLIGSGLSRETIRTVGPRPFAQGTLLWVIVTSVTLFGLCFGWIN